MAKHDPIDREGIEAAMDGNLIPGHQAVGVPGHDAAQRVARATRAVRMRMQGMTYEQIATELGYAERTTAREIVMTALSRHEAETVKEMRIIENQRLDSDERVLRAIISDTTKSDLARTRAIDARLRLAARRARLNGLDAEIDVHITVTEESPAEKILERLAAMNVTVEGEVVDITDAAPPPPPRRKADGE